MESNLDELEECVDTAFAIIDQDRDGIITTNDIYRLMIHLGEVLWDDQVAAILQAADMDGDGRISKKGESTQTGVTDISEHFWAELEPGAGCCVYTLGAIYTWESFTLGSYLQMGAIYSRESVTLGGDLHFGAIYTWESFTLGSYSQLGAIYSWESVTLGDDLHFGVIYTWESFTLGSYLQLGVSYTWK